MANVQTFQTQPSAYYLTDPSAPAWYGALLRVARQSLGVQLKEAKRGEALGSRGHVIIPPGLYSSAIPGTRDEEREEARDAIAARALLPVANMFLYYKASCGAGLERRRGLGVTVVGSLGALFTACCQLPSLLTAYEVQRILESRTAGEARFLLHELQGVRGARKDLRALEKAVRSCIADAVRLGLLSRDGDPFGNNRPVWSDEVTSTLQAVLEGRNG